MTWHIPVARPLPNVTDHVVKSVPIGWEAAYRRDACITVLFSIIDRKDALPGIGDGLAILIEGLTPVLTLVAAAACGVFPLRLGRKFTSEPVSIRKRILISDMDDGMVLRSFDG